MSWMSDDILKRHFDIDSDYQFREVCGLTFVFKRNFISIKDKLSSAEIKPVGIIYTEKGQEYFAPLDSGGNIEEIIEEYVKNCYQK